MSNMERLTRFIDFDRTFKPDYDIKSTITEENIEVLDIEFMSSLDGRVSAYLVTPTGSGPFPAIHFIHWLETEADDSNRTQFLPYAKKLAGMGYVSILPDCFWSLDKEKFKENPRFYIEKWWKTGYEHDSQLLRRQITELLCSHKILITHDKVDNSNVGLVAHDFGAMTGSLLPVLGFSYHYYCFKAFTARFSDWFRFGSKLPEEDPEAFQQYVDSMSFFDPIEYISQIGEMPIMMHFANDDFYVPKNMANKLFDAAPQNKDLRWYEAKHGLNQKAFDDMLEWVLQTSRSE